MTKDSEKFLRVTDSSCTAEAPERTHDVFVRGVLTRTVFKLGEALILPFEHGIKFMLDGFKVEEADGRTLNLPAVTKESVRSELAADQVIANLSELTLASLKLRAGQKKGGEVYLDADDDARGDLIAFIMGTPPAAAAEEPAETIDDEDDLIADDEEGDGEVFVGLKGENTDPAKELGVSDLTEETLGNDAPAPASNAGAAGPLGSSDTVTDETK